MSSHDKIKPFRANMFHSGNTCPFCQEIIQEGQLIVTCDVCGAIQHETCWMHNNGCGSYFCNKSSTSRQLTPDIIISELDLESVIVPQPSVSADPAQAAKPFFQTRPKRYSRLSIISLALALCSGIGVAGILFNTQPLILFGISIALLSIIIGVISLTIINNDSSIVGGGFAGSGIGLSGLLLLFSVLIVTRNYSQNHNNENVNFQLSDQFPNEEDLTRMPAHQSKALRANVVIRSISNTLFTGATTIGSGVVINRTENKVYIITNKHVISQDRENHVVFYTGEISTASVVWLAPGTIDAAIISCIVLHVENILPVLTSKQPLYQGATVFAIGNPLGLNWSYTEGLISGIRQQVIDGHPFVIYQTQTPINQGNSGGGLYETSGSLIGINTWTQDKSISEGLNFSISLQSIIDLLSENQKSEYFVSVP